MKLYAKIIIFIAVLMGAALWANIHFSRLAVSEAMSAQIFDAAANVAADLAPEFRRALVSGKELDGIKALHAFTQRPGAVHAALTIARGSDRPHQRGAGRHPPRRPADGQGTAPGRAGFLPAHP